jgi:hypothetical protein
MKQKYMAEEMSKREEEAANALLELAVNPFVFWSTQQAYNQLQVEEARRWEEEQEARIREQEAIKADIKARINDQERGSGMKVPGLRSMPRNPHREGRSDDQNGHREPKTLHGNFRSDNNSNSADQAVSVSDDDTVSEGATIPDADSNNEISVCSTCGYNSKLRYNHDPAACILADIMKKNKRRRASHGEEQEQAAKKAATGREHPSMPSTAPELLDDGFERRATDTDDVVPSRPGSRMSTATNESSNTKEYNTLDIFSPSNISIPRAPLSYVRGLPRDDDSQKSDTSKKMEARRETGSSTVAPTSKAAVFVPDLLPTEDLTANAIEEARRASISLTSIAGDTVTAEIAALKAISKSEQLHVPAKGNDRVRSISKRTQQLGAKLTLA